MIVHTPPAHSSRFHCRCLFLPVTVSHPEPSNNPICIFPLSGIALQCVRTFLRVLQHIWIFNIVFVSPPRLVYAACPVNSPVDGQTSFWLRTTTLLMYV